MTTMTPPNTSARIISRAQFIELLRSAISGGSSRFARRAALAWLAAYPGDLQINLLYAQTLFKLNDFKQVMPVLENLCLVDPEFQEAQTMLGKVHQAAEMNLPEQVHGSIYALGGEVRSKNHLPIWARLLRETRQALANGEGELAEGLIHQALLVEPLPPLVAVTHLAVATNRGFPTPAMLDLAGFYHQRWPACLPFTLHLVEALMNVDDQGQAVALLHQAAAQDVAGQVVRRLWGPDHAYKVIWPEKLEIELDMPIPAEVSAVLGWNRLATGGGSSPAVARQTLISQASAQIQTPDITDKEHWTLGEIPNPAGQGDEASSQSNGKNAHKGYSIPDSLRPIQSEFEKVAARLKSRHLAQADGRYPVYVIFSNRQGLQRQYGDQIHVIDGELKKLSEAITNRLDWSSVLVYADDAISMSAFGLEPATPGDPWSLKLALLDIDTALARRGEMIGAVLIVGGPEVVPFHHLPNPVDDADMDVPSDNPYGTRDENYFVPEWIVGRIPGGAQPDAAPLLATLQKMTAYHQEISHQRAWYMRSAQKLAGWMHRRLSRKRPSYGYTAAIWRRASSTVFRPIGDPGGLMVSPPTQVQENQRRKLLPAARLGYFNLHGLPDSNEWYGQRDPTEPGETLDYPVAMRTQDVLNHGRAPQVVFSEACFGAHVLGKGIEDALSLKFLNSGSRVVIGSTCTAYGSITTPLIGADLLGHSFWRYLREGLVAGEALRRAKIHTAREMLRRQGYLDGEDQKTLISFVLYGDPLAQIADFGIQPKGIYRPLQHPTELKTICDRSLEGVDCGELHAMPDIPAETLVTVKRVVEKYLPGMADAQFTISESYVGCQGKGHQCPTSQLGSKSLPPQALELRVVTLSKHVEKKDFKSPKRLVHSHYARLTLDKKGKVIKMAVSR
jgi:hypothetical protein